MPSRYERLLRKLLRKKFKDGDKLSVEYQRVAYLDPAIAFECFICNGPAGPWPHPNATAGMHGAVIIDAVALPLCETCFGSEQRDDELVRKLTGSPDATALEGEAS